MSEHPATVPSPARTPATTSSRRQAGTRHGRRWITPALLLGVVAIFAICFSLAPKSGAEDQSFGGTDSKVTDILSSHGVKPWAHPLFEPGSSEVESGLFAMQAALGAGLFGFAIGNLRGRKVERERLDAASGGGNPGTPALESASGADPAPHVAAEG